jgi:hypothetical protein
MLSGLYVDVARLSALALDGVPGLLGTGEDGAKLSSCEAADGGVAVLMEGSGLLGGVCRSVCDRDSRVGEFGPGSEPAEDQAVMKLRTARKEGQVVAWKNKEGGLGDVPLGLGMFAAIPGCRTRARQCDLRERWCLGLLGGLLGRWRCLGKSEWQVMEEGRIDWWWERGRCGMQAAREDGRGAKTCRWQYANQNRQMT